MRHHQLDHQNWSGYGVRLISFDFEAFYMRSDRSSLKYTNNYNWYFISGSFIIISPQFTLALYPVSKAISGLAHRFMGIWECIHLFGWFSHPESTVPRFLLEFPQFWPFHWNHFYHRWRQVCSFWVFFRHFFKSKKYVAWQSDLFPQPLMIISFLGGLRGSQLGFLKNPRSMNTIKSTVVPSWNISKYLNALMACSHFFFFSPSERLS